MVFGSVQIAHDVARCRYGRRRGAFAGMATGTSMIHSLSLRKFKRFKSQQIPLSRSGVLLIAGGNNSGKSTILHALAIWEFCRTLIEAEKGRDAFLPESRVQGLGLGDDEFSPLLVPSLNHLWTNLTSQKTSGDSDGYTLRIRCDWDDSNNTRKELEFGLALANDRLFAKTTHSNLASDDKIPHAAYLPPFAGITDRESRLPIAIRRRRIGEGLAGAVLRNLLLDLQTANVRRRTELRDGRTKIRDSDLQELRETDPWEVLQQALRTTFGAELSIQPFREEYHSYIRVEVVRGTLTGYRISRYQGYKSRDLMVEGSGFLQWLSVFALATDPSISILLLDEPDAHLHSSLQGLLLEKLEVLAAKSGKQVLVATHSSEILRHSPPPRILQVSTNQAPRFLVSEEQKVGLLAGMGSDYAPKIDRVKRTRRLLLIEGEFDVRVLKQVCEITGSTWPDNWVEWKSAAGHKERTQLFRALREEIPDLVAVSLRDRDDEALESVDDDLNDKGHTDAPSGFHSKKWRRRHIESYLIWPPAIAKATGLPEDTVQHRLRDEFGLAIGASFRDAAAPQAILDCRGKSVLKALNADPDCVIPRFAAEDVPADLQSIVGELQRLA